jgi:hypothetical protein
VLKLDQFSVTAKKVEIPLLSSLSMKAGNDVADLLSSLLETILPNVQESLDINQKKKKKKTAETLVGIEQLVVVLHV